MAKFLDSISDELKDFIIAQRIFFVASAPLSPTGHVNLSPKGMDTFRVLSPNRVIYLDLTGSGNETAAHLAENGRITFMFCSFVEKPLILRLYGVGRAVMPASTEFVELAESFPAYPGIRQIISTRIQIVQTSCGFGVPTMGSLAERDMLIKWAEKKGEEGLAEYRRNKNARSIDSLPAPIPSDAE